MIEGRRARSLAFLGGIAGAALALLSLTQPWLSAHVADTDPLAVGADVAAPAVSALAVASLALVGAVAIANTAVRWVLGAVQLLLGLGVVFATVTTLHDTVGAAVPAVSSVTGISGETSVRELVTGVDVALWPWLAIVAGGILMLTGVWTVMTARSWPGSGTKYGGTATAGSAPAVSEWDALSEGADPTNEAEATD
ncbi:MAG: Trp biosynthesis-associated membrane protein [Cryobacterium sp.]|nr:Trp biosynthesis-associated membrane protein [Cryobacterium sp.]